MKPKKRNIYLVPQVSLLKSGYERVFHKGKYRRLHRLIMEDWLLHNMPKSKFLLRGKLRKEVLVHHKNNLKTDNRIENLECMFPKEHSKIHLDKYPNMTYNEKQKMWHGDLCKCGKLKQKYSQVCKFCYWNRRKTK